MPRPRPNTDDLAEGTLTIGVINDAIEDGPGGDVQGADTLVISADVPRHGTLHRTVICPLSMPGSGRDVLGQSISFRHTTFDTDFVNDILVVRWPPKIHDALQPSRSTERRTLRSHAWRILGALSFVVMWIGIVLTPIALCELIFRSGMYDDLAAGVHPGHALAVSICAIPGGLVAAGFCFHHAEGGRRGARTPDLPGVNRTL